MGPCEEAAPNTASQRCRAVDVMATQRGDGQAILDGQGVAGRGVGACGARRKREMMLAFLIDRCRQRCCALFQAAQVKAGRTPSGSGCACGFGDPFPERETSYRALTFGHRAPVPFPLDTS